jgi:hypothetical protein
MYAVLASRTFANAEWTALRLRILAHRTVFPHRKARILLDTSIEHIPEGELRASFVALPGVESLRSGNKCC